MNVYHPYPQPYVREECVLLVTVSKLIFWSAKGKRSIGRGIKTYHQILAEDKGLNSENEIKNLMRDRHLWRQRVRNVLVSSKDD